MVTATRACVRHHILAAPHVLIFDCQSLTIRFGSVHSQLYQEPRGRSLLMVHSADRGYTHVNTSSATNGQPPAKRKTADERREDVIAVAIVEFATFGYHGGSTERIAVDAGISQPYVLRLFGTKKAIFLAAFHRVCANILSTWMTANARLDEENRPQPPTPADRLFAMGESFLGLVEDVNDLRLVLQAFGSAEDEDIRIAAHAGLKEMFDWVWHTTGAGINDVRQHFAYGMMLMVAASIRAGDKFMTEPWARAFLMVPLEEDGSVSTRLLGQLPPYQLVKIAH